MAQEPGLGGENDKIPEYERLGLSQVEWNLVVQHKMSMDKVKKFLRDGISIAEYFRQPWKEFGISEARWLQNRRRGISDDDMRARCRKPSSGEWAVVQNFFVPGLHQWLRCEYGKAAVMSGVAAGSLLLFAALPGEKNPAPFAVVLAADMVWSSIDIGLTVGRENNPDAARFSAIVTARGGAGLMLTRGF
jgi:hypothetical protein